MTVTDEHCINIVTGETYGQYVDIVSEISNRELVALVYLASKGEDRRTSEKKDSDFSLVDVIYNVARSGNAANPDSKNHSVICSSMYISEEAFHKLALSLKKMSFFM